MARRKEPVSPVNLDSGNIGSASPDELAAILHAADSIVHRAGRSQLVKLLKGSRDKRLLELGLDADPSYGALSHLKLAEIAHLVDWTIEHGFLTYYFEWRMPLLALTERGWKIERPMAARKHFEAFCRDVEANDAKMAERMTDIKFEVQRDVTHLIGEYCDERCLAHLDEWEKPSTKRVRKAIGNARREIKTRSGKTAKAYPGARASDSLIRAIRSGGQTGVDRGALDAALEAWVPIGGWCPLDGWAEDMPVYPGLLSAYPQLVETPSADVSQRTEWNVRDSDSTLVICPDAVVSSPGTQATIEYAVKLGKPYLVIGEEGVSDAVAWLESLKTKTPRGIHLNVAGPRESSHPGIYRISKNIVLELLQA